MHAFALIAMLHKYHSFHVLAFTLENAGHRAEAIFSMVLGTRVVEVKELAG